MDGQRAAEIAFKCGKTEAVAGLGSEDHVTEASMLQVKRRRMVEDSVSAYV